jgi:hypothetical protein
MATLFVEGVPELQDVGITLGDIRITYPTAFIRDHGAQNAHRSNGFVLGNGQYDLIVPAPAGLCASLSLALSNPCVQSLLSLLCLSMVHQGDSVEWWNVSLKSDSVENSTIANTLQSLDVPQKWGLSLTHKTKISSYSPFQTLSSLIAS